MNISTFISELEQIPHFLQHRRSRIFQAPSSEIHNPNLTFFYNVITHRLFIISSFQETLLIASSGSDIDLKFNKNDTVFQQIIDMEKNRVKLYASPNIQLFDKDISEILSNFILVNKVGNKNDPLSKIVKNKQGVLICH